MLEFLAVVTSAVASSGVPKGSLACFALGAALMVVSAVAWVSDWCDQAAEGPDGPNPRLDPLDCQALLRGDQGAPVR